MNNIPVFPPTSYAISHPLPGVPVSEALTRTRTALATQGFGVLTEINMQATLKARLNQDIREYVILGACNPGLAHQALVAEPGVGLLLPCNIVVSADDQGGSIVSAVDPLALFGVVQRPDILSLAQQVRDRLASALAALEA